MKRARFLLLPEVVARRARYARLASARRGPNKHGRHFHRLDGDLLHARRLGMDPRVFRGVPR